MKCRYPRWVLGLVCRKRPFNTGGIPSDKHRQLVITVSAGNITGSTTLHVIPGDAVASELMVVDAPEMFMAGESAQLVFERRDANGYIGFVSPSIHAVSAILVACRLTTMHGCFGILQPLGRGHYRC